MGSKFRLSSVFFPPKHEIKRLLSARSVGLGIAMAENLSEYELQRLRNIATNRARLAELALDDALDTRTQRRTLSAEEIERRSAAGAVRVRSGWLARVDPNPTLALASNPLYQT